MVTGVLIAARIISSYAAMAATFIFRPSVAPRLQSRKRQLMLPLLLGWTGMRGVVSLAAALAIPVTLANGENFPHRNLILFITFVVILLTLVLQGLTLPYLIKRSGLYQSFIENDKEEKTRHEIKKGLKKHIYETLKDKYENELQDNTIIEKILKQWEERAKASDDSWMTKSTQDIFLNLIESQREYLAILNKDPKIDESIIRQHLYLLDLEEERLKNS